jgi:hypothetical protein
MCTICYTCAMHTCTICYTCAMHTSKSELIFRYWSVLSPCFLIIFVYISFLSQVRQTHTRLCVRASEDSTTLTQLGLCKRYLFISNFCNRYQRSSHVTIQHDCLYRNYTYHASSFSSVSRITPNPMMFPTAIYVGNILCNQKCKKCYCYDFTVSLTVLRFLIRSWGHAVAQLVEKLRYKLEGRGFDYRWCHPSGRNMALGWTQPLTEMSTRNISWG